MRDYTAYYAAPIAYVIFTHVANKAHCLFTMNTTTIQFFCKTIQRWKKTRLAEIYHIVYNQNVYTVASRKNTK